MERDGDASGEVEMLRAARRAAALAAHVLAHGKGEARHPQVVERAAVAPRRLYAALQVDVPTPRERALAARHPTEWRWRLGAAEPVACVPTEHPHRAQAQQHRAAAGGGSVLELTDLRKKWKGKDVRRRGDTREIACVLSPLQRPSPSSRYR